MGEVSGDNGDDVRVASFGDAVSTVGVNGVRMGRPIFPVGC